MNNLNETEKFDSLFKDAALDFELPINEAAWNKMQQKLDGEQPKKKRWGLWLLPIAVVAIVAGVYTFEKSKPSNVAVVSNSPISTNENAISSKSNIKDEHSKVEPANSINIDETLIDDKNDNKLENNNLGNKNENINSTKIIRKIASRSNQTITSNTQNQNKTNEITTLKNSSITSKNEKNLSANSNATVGKIPKNASNSINRQPEMADKKATNDNLKTIESISEVKNGTRYYTATNLFLHNHYLLNPKKTALETELAVAALEKKIKDEQDAERTRIQNADHPFLTERRNVPTTDWYVTAALANNIGYVSNPRIDASSLQYHIGVGYNINKYVSIETGLTIGRRNFFAKKDQYMYQIPPYAIKYFQGVNANFSVVDIPLNLKFQFSDRENHGFYGIAGISTLFLPKENYSLKVVHSSTYYIEQDFTNSQTILGLLNLSIGYQFPVNKNFTITTEPYLQLPFKNIGDGGTKLCSVGFQVGGRYNFDRKKKK